MSMDLIIISEILVDNIDNGLFMDSKKNGNQKLVPKVSVSSLFMVIFI